MAELILEQSGDELRLAAGGAELARYRVADAGIPAVNTPKPYFHPLRTLGGTVITGFAPEDHPWHHGLQFAFPRVGAHNLWGGGTYFGPERGYVVVEDQGSIRHRRWISTAADGAAGTFAHELEWLGHEGEPLLREQRGFTVELLDDAEHPGWALQLDTVLTNIADAALPLETPAQRGRADGGYGGLFLRFGEEFAARRLLGDGKPVTASGAESDRFVIQGATQAGEEVTVGMHYGPGASPGVRKWLYRFEPFSLAGFAVAYDEGLSIPVGGQLSFSHRLAFFDGIVPEDAVHAALR